MLYLFHGEDEFTRSAELAKLKERLGDPAMASLNMTVLDGRKVNLAALIQTCNTLPFMSDRRLVIVEDFWSRFELREGSRAKERQPQISAADAAFIKGLLEYLPRLPQTTRLVFIESRSLRPTNPVFSALPADKKQVYTKEFSPPAERDLGLWVEQRMKAKGGTITAQAAHELARLIGSDLRQLDQELEKLLAYANFQRPVTINDVHNLVSAKQLADVFDLVDAIGLRGGERAMRSLHELLDGGAPPLYLLSMIERQFRILLQVKELGAQGTSVAQMQKALGISHTFIIEKSLRQAQNFSMAQLESIYAHLAEVEQDIKTGEISELLALDLLVAELCA